MQTIQLSTELDAPVDVVWELMQRPDTFLYLVRGLFAMPALAGRTEPFTVGETGTGWLLALHVLPVSKHTITVESMDATTHTIQTRERSELLRVWNHTLHVAPLEPARSRYTDTVSIEAGWLTPVVTRGATEIFKYRQRRWHQLVRERLAPSTRPD